MATVAYRGADYPLFYDNDTKLFYMSRVQDFSANKNQNAENYYELGTDETIGATTEAERYSGSLSWVPINLNFFRMLAKEDPDDNGVTEVTLTDLMNHAGIKLHGKSRGLEGAVPQSLEISIAVRSRATASVQFRGTKLITSPTSPIIYDGSTNAATATEHEDGQYYDPDENNGVAKIAGSSFMYDEITMELASSPGTAIARVQRVQIRSGFSVDETEEMGFLGVVDADAHTPTVTMTVDLLDGDSTPDASIPFDTPDDIVLKFGSSPTLTITMEDAFSNSEGNRAQVRGFATRQYTYMVKAPGASGGLKFS